MSRVVVFSDSLAFHGPQRSELTTRPELWPNVLAAALPGQVELVARLGWTARDVWWSMTKDPRVYSELLPGADAVVLAVGGMDYLPAAVPTYLREGIPYLPHERLRRAARAVYLAAQPRVPRLHGGRWRTLSQRRTDEYLSLCVRAVRALHPRTVFAGFVPPPHDAPLYGRVTGGWRPAFDAAWAWGEREGVPMLDVAALVGPELAAGRCNPDGMHWSWAAHRAVGEGYADLLRPLLAEAADRGPS